MKSTIILKIETDSEREENLLALVAVKSYLMDELDLDSTIQVYDVKSDSPGKLATNEKLITRLKNDVESCKEINEATEGPDFSEFTYETVDIDLVIKNILNTLKEYDKYYDQKRIG